MINQPAPIIDGQLRPGRTWVTLLSALVNACKDVIINATSTVDLSPLQTCSREICHSRGHGLKNQVVSVILGTQTIITQADMQTSGAKRIRLYSVSSSYAAQDVLFRQDASSLKLAFMGVSESASSNGIH
jgi:hypothetical protein